MKALDFLLVNHNEYGIVTVPKSNSELKDNLTTMRFEREVRPGQYETLYNVTMNHESPSTFVPCRAANYDRVFVEYEHSPPICIWSRTLQQTEIRISGAVYQKDASGELHKKENALLPAENINHPIFMVHTGSMETQILVRDVWVSPHTNDIAPIIWNDEHFDRMEKESDFDVNLLDFEIPGNSGAVADAMKDALSDIDNDESEDVDDVSENE